MDERSLQRVQFLRSARPGEVRVLELGCGTGAQAERLATAGAHVIATDLRPEYAPTVDARRLAVGLERGALEFCTLDVRELSDGLIGPDPFDLIVCQRTIHYIRYREAVDAVRAMGRLLVPSGQLYLSASGLDSELGERYSGASVPITDRFAPLVVSQAERHNIRGPVCLYTRDELFALLTQAAFKVEYIERSEFGNVKATACPLR